MCENTRETTREQAAGRFHISIRGTEKLNLYEELIKVFLQPFQYSLNGEDAPGQQDIILEYEYAGDPDELKRRLYRDLKRCTGKAPKWGILTGIRPVKLAYELAFGAKAGAADQSAGAKEHAASGGGENDRVARARRILEDVYLLHPEKAALTTEILQYQRRTAGDPQDKSLSVYIGIPFCPTRCLYCSFTSNQVGEEEIRRYLAALEREIREVAVMAERDGFRIESVYMGGGTPTTPDAEQLDRLLYTIRQAFRLREDQPLREFTVEAGRPDTITEEKLAILREHGADRISINPQSMQQRTLDVIGRRHTTEQTKEAFALAKNAGFASINADLIAGLPGEVFSDFEDSLEQVIALGADNITLHTLAVKRASRLKEMDEHFNYREEDLREQMLRFAARRLREEGYRPYYLYRQKHTSGNTENIGYCREDKISIYNIRIMEERQSILALGAGGISKVWFPRENRLERVPNVSNYEIYIDRIDDMIQRKRKKFFDWRNETC